MGNEAKALVAEIAAELCLERIKRPRSLGAYVEHLPGLDVNAFVNTLGARSDRALRCAVLGGPRAVRGGKHLETTTDSLEANHWRNEAAKKLGVPLITLVVGQAPKLSSLRNTLKILGPAEVREEIVKRSVSLLDTPERRSFWQALAARPGDVPLPSLTQLAAAVKAASQRSEAGLLDAEPALLHTVGLLSMPINARGPRAARSALQKNYELVRRLRKLPKKERDIVVAASNDKKHELQRVADQILRFEQSGATEDLIGLSMEKVRQLLRPESAGGEDDERKGGRKGGAERLDGDELALELILEENGHGLQAAAKRFKDAISPDEEGAIETEEFHVNHRRIVPRVKTGTTQLLKLLSDVHSRENWGAFIAAKDATDIVSALRVLESGDAEVTLFRPDADEHVRPMLQRAVNQGIAERTALDRWDAYSKARAALLPNSLELTNHPLLALTPNSQLRERAEAVLKTFGAALDTVGETIQGLLQRNSLDAAKRLRAKVLALDVLFVQTGEDWSAMALPTHPFHLWRWLALADVALEHREELQQLGLKTTRPLVTDPAPAAPALVLSPFALEDGALDHARPFIPTGTFSALPLFSEPQARQGGKFRARSLGKLAGRMVSLLPHSSFGLRVLLVNPSTVTGALEDLLSLQSAFDDERPVPIHVTIARSKRGAEATDEEEEDLVEISRELREAGGSLTVLPGILPLQQIAERFSKAPVHMAVVFDPGEGQQLRVGLSGAPRLSPLLLPRVYRYDEYDDRFDVVFAAEEPGFATYQQFFCEMLEVPKSDFIGRRSGASRTARELEKFALAAVWLVVVDQGLEPTLRIGATSRLDWRTDGGREVVTFTAHTDTVDQLVRDAIRSVGLKAGEETVKRTLSQVLRLNSEALLQLARADTSVAPADPRIAKGLLGVLAAVRWYEEIYPDALVISLDERTSRTWILGQQPDDRHGDLLGVRPGKGGSVIVEAIEVKTYDDPAAVTKERGGRVEGYAITQIDQTLRILKEILDPRVGSVISRARRDVLRDQLYRSLASRPYSRTERARFVHLLEELFNEGPGTFSGLLFKVQVISGPPQSVPSAPAPAKSADGNEVGVVELIESEAPGERVEEERQREPKKKGPPRSSGSGGDGGSRQKASEELATSSAAKQRDAPAVQAQTAPKRFTFLVGQTIADEEVVWDPHRPDAPLNNFGWLVTGDSGAGKTQVLLALVADMVKAGLPVCIFDFKNDYADAKFSKPLALRVHDVDREGLPFNPLSLVADEHGEVSPIRHIHEIAGILRKVLRLGDQQEAKLKRALRAAYEHRGITVDGRHQLAKLPVAPSFKDVWEVLEQDAKNDQLLNRLSKLLEIDIFPTSEQAAITFERLLKESIVLDLHKLPNEEVKNGVAEFLVVRFHGHVLRGEQPRQLRRMLVFDEAWRVKDSERLQELAREGRAFGVGIAIGTQFPGDIPDTLAGNLATQLLLHNKQPEHRKVVARTLTGAASGQTATQVMTKIDKLRPHEGFFRNQHYSPYVLVHTLPYYKRS
ncbi:MAG TPA: DUF87 domain-containing protein [Myxococcaceae bacterium]|nr:DUF87 domain-containing protein [Myxococcaceae bacterium]